MNLNLLDNLSEQERALALQILKEYSDAGNSATYKDLLFVDFDEIPVDIDTFLHNKKYLGNALYDAEGKFTLFPYWENKLKDIFPDNLTTKYNTVILTGAIGLGKAQPLDSLVLCENGFKRMGDLSLSDKVYGNDGELHDILGIFPQGKKKICKVTFTDGTSTLCCDEHLWTVYNTKNQCWTTVETKQLIDGSRNLKHAYGHRYKIPMTAPVNFKHKDVIIDPYLFGCLLGDGHIKEAVTFASNDAEIVNNIKSIISEDYEVRKVKAKYNYSICKIKNTTRWDEDLHTQVPTPNKYFEAIKKYNLNTTTINKYIPADYLYNDVESRIALLQGLMDTDGYISKDGSLIEFTTISKNLCDNFVSLVQSLGGICHIRTKHPSYKDKNGNKVFCNISYNIGIKLPKSIKPFRLSRKVERLSDKALEPFRYIASIEYVGEDNCQCIYIDSKEHLYLTNDYIVTHNTLVAVVCLLYMLYRLLCLKDPYLYYGLQPIDKISISLMNITIENAKGVAMDKMNQMLLSSDWFMSHGEMRGTTNLEYVPEKHIEIVAASSNNQVIGRALFANFTDEVNFGLTNDVEKLKKKQKQLISQVDARMKSRFMRGTYLPTMNIIASSKNSDQSFLDDYINTKKKNESSTTLIVDEPQWVVDSRKDSKEHFWVAVGNKFLANELLPKNSPAILVEEYRAKGYQMLEVPIGYYENFQDNIDGALTDIAGIATASSLKYISGMRWNDIKDDRFQNPFVKEIIEVGNAKDDLSQYQDYFDLTKVPKNLKSRPLYIHLDMSKTGDKTGIAGTWIVGKRPKIEGESASRELFFQVAFSVSIKAPKGAEISFDKHRTFIRWLKQQGFAIKGISSDTYQSAQLQQQLTADGFNVSTISVDRLDSETKTQLQYAYLKSTIYERRLTVYKNCDFLTEEVLGLERISDGHIEHPDSGTKGSKDSIDAVCGALWNASLHADEYAFEYGEELAAAVDASMTNNAFEQTQFNKTFEEELKGIMDPLNQKQQQNQDYFMNFGFGSAQLLETAYLPEGIIVF